MPKDVEKCVAKVKKQKGIHSAYAICTAAHNRKKRRKR